MPFGDCPLKLHNSILALGVITHEAFQTILLCLGKREDEGILSLRPFSVWQCFLPGESSPFNMSPLLQFTSFPAALPLEDVDMMGSSPSLLITALYVLAQLPLAFPFSFLVCFPAFNHLCGSFLNPDQVHKVPLKALFSFKTNTGVSKLVQTGKMR